MNLNSKNTSRLRFKATVQCDLIGEAVYFSSAGKSLKLKDNSGYIKCVCEMIKHGKRISEIYECVREVDGENECYVADLINSLDKKNFLDLVNDDSEGYVVSPQKSYDKVRWSRNTEFFNSFCTMSEDKFRYQEILKNIKVTLLGLGGLGSHILYDLVALGVHNIRAVDFDSIELSNLNRQILYSEDDVGCRKTVIAKQKISAFLSNGNFEFIDKKLNSLEDVERIVLGSDFVIAVADQPRLFMQKWVNSACIRHKIPFITGGVGNKRAMYFSVIPGNTGCTECWRKQVEKENLIADEIIKNTWSKYSPYDNVPAPAMVNLVSIITGLMITEFIKLVTKISTPQATGKLWTFDFDSATLVNTESWDRDSSCVVCGEY